MADTFTLIVTLTKKVQSPEEAQNLVDMVKTKLDQYPEIAVHAQCSIRFEDS